MLVSLVTLRRSSYVLSLLLGAGYVIYVLTLKLIGHVIGGPLGEVGEFVLVLASVTLFAVGLFADEAQRERDGAEREAS